jgi:hypothetical protein
VMNTNGKWQNEICSDWSGDNGYICEKQKVKGDSRPTAPPPPPPLIRRDNKTSGLSGGDTAGVVIGVLLSVGVIGAVVFVIVTGRRQVVVSRVQSMATSVRDNSMRFMRRGNGRNSDDKEPAIPYSKGINPNYEEAGYTGADSYT